MKLRLELADGQHLEFDEEAVEVLCPKCSEWFRLDLHAFKDTCPICERYI
jgi:Zn finger protein HypA/HybF involved in hydrogenase expression